MNEISITLKNKINELHNEINNDLKKTVVKAIQIGKLLTEAKEASGHGNFMDWIEKNCSFSDRIARQYIQVFEYKDKTARLANLNEAYSVIKELEYEKKDNEYKKKIENVKVKMNDFSKDKDWQKIKEDELKKQAEIKSEKDYKYTQINTDSLINDLQQHFRKFEDLKSGVSGNEDIIAIIEVKLNTLLNNSRRLEFCNTIIKFLREKAISYNKNS